MNRYLPLALFFLLPAFGVRAADTDGPAGRIVYTRQEGEQATLHVMNADGSGDRTLPGPTATLNLFPSWSPDGKRIAFMSGSRESPPRVCVMNADGTGLLTLQTPGRLSGQPAWSPDGKRLAFAAGDGAPAIYVAEADGTNARQVSPPGAGSMLPFWLADGKALGYSRVEAPGVADVVKVPIDGGAEEPLTRTGRAVFTGGGALSPDGKRLAYVAADRTAKIATLHVLDLTTRVETSLTDLNLEYVGGVFSNPAPAWSPDGKWLLIPIAGDKGIPLYRISEDGKTRLRITPEDSRCLQASWTAR